MCEIVKKDFKDEYADIFITFEYNFDIRVYEIKNIILNFDNIILYKNIDIRIVLWMTKNHISTHEKMSLGSNIELMNYIIQNSYCDNIHMIFDLLIEIEADFKIVSKYISLIYDKENIDDDYFYFLKCSINNMKYSIFVDIIKNIEYKNQITKEKCIEYILLNGSFNYIEFFIDFYERKIEKMYLLSDNKYILYDKKQILNQSYEKKIKLSNDKKIVLINFKNLIEDDILKIYDKFDLILECTNVRINTIWNYFNTFDKKYSENKKNLFFNDRKYFEYLLKSNSKVEESVKLLNRFINILNYEDIISCFSNCSKVKDDNITFFSLLEVSKKEYSIKNSSHIIMYFFNNFKLFSLNKKVITIKYFLGNIIRVFQMGVGLISTNLKNHQRILKKISDMENYSINSYLVYCLLCNPHFTNKTYDFMFEFLKSVDYKIQKYGNKTIIINDLKGIINSGTYDRYGGYINDKKANSLLKRIENVMKNNSIKINS